MLLLPLTTNVAYESELNCFCSNVTVHLYTPCCCGNALLMILKGKAEVYDCIVHIPIVLPVTLSEA